MTKKELSEKDVFLIIYPNGIKKEGEKTLKTLNRFSREYFSVFSNLHILPFFESTSDEGFAVSDYRKVDSKFGDWEDIEKISESFNLMFDGVLNHTSSHHPWFEKARKREGKFEKYYISYNKKLESDNVFRPRGTSLTTKYDDKYYRTTFGEDQIDLNYENTFVVKEMMNILSFYEKKGASFIRLDAVAYLFKESMDILKGKSFFKSKICSFIENLQKSLSVKLVSEVNLENEVIENFRRLIPTYNFSLPALVYYAFCSGDLKPLFRHLRKSHENDFNFLASHDGIGLNPARSYLNEEKINILCSDVTKKGFEISYGGEKPYELNINFLDALGDENRMLCAYSLLFSIKGTPLVYYHSILGSKGKRNYSFPREINRERLEEGRLIEEIENCKERKTIYDNMCEMIKKRKSCSSFHPRTRQKVYLKDKLLIIERGEKEKIFCYHNISPETVEIEKGFDILSQKFIKEIKPFGFSWVKEK